jgi:hypothetical protein
MRLDVEDVARHVVSGRSRHERLAPETELRFGLAIRIAIAEDERHFSPRLRHAPVCAGRGRRVEGHACATRANGREA